MKMKLQQVFSLCLLFVIEKVAHVSAFTTIPVKKVTTLTPQTTSTTIPGRSTELSNSARPDFQTGTPSQAADFDALLKYHGAIFIQLGLIAGVLKGLDIGYDLVGSPDIPTLALFPIFYAFSLKSRAFNPLDNARPNLQKAVEGEQSRGFQDRVMPSWTPPGPVFPIMWLLIIGPLRAYSSALVWQANGHEFLHPALFALVFHLAVGDIWNTMNNSEQRFGASVTGVLCVTASALNAAYQYHVVDETAGNLLGLPMIWFAVASSLVTATWRLNPSESGELDPLYPVVRPDRKQTSFAWFGASESP
mmetsp:Transcript_10899/g.16071  ORF Transcript_10899/g.16071 Transcript_10899/m.16071 type:complete len:305 (-) Transcript_10899:21-935(-)